MKVEKGIRQRSHRKQKSSVSVIGYSVLIDSAITRWWTWSSESAASGGIWRSDFVGQSWKEIMMTPGADNRGVESNEFEILIIFSQSSGNVTPRIIFLSQERF